VSEACKWKTVWGFWYPGCETFGLAEKPLIGATCPYCGKPIAVEEAS
jgi:hypothetical protein